MRERFSISLDEDSIKAISTISAKTGLTKSYIVGQWVKEGLKSDNNLSRTDKFFFSKKIILEQIDMLFNSIGYSSKNGDICSNIVILFLIPRLCFQSEKEYSLFRLSVFQLIDKIHIHDCKLHESIIDSLKELNLKVSKNSELSEEYKSSETSLLPARGTGITIDTNSVTELERRP